MSLQKWQDRWRSKNGGIIFFFTQFQQVNFRSVNFHLHPKIYTLLCESTVTLILPHFVFKLFVFFFKNYELSPKTRIELGRIPGWAVPNFVKLRRDPSKIKYLPSRLCVASYANGGGFRKPVNGVVEGDGVIIVDHGSRRKESNLMLSKTLIFFNYSVSVL